MIECSTIPIKDYRKRLTAVVGKNRIPLFGMMELTYRCNLNCVHCYIPRDYREQRELSFDEITGIIDEIVREGCLFLLFSGGEPFVRGDFKEIFTYAKRKGMIVYIYTNAFHIPEEFFELFKRYKPTLVDISLYGAGEDTYELTTGRRGFSAVIENAKRLIEIGVPVKMKTTILRTNVDDFDRCMKIHEDLNLEKRLNAKMHYSYNGNSYPGDYRLSPEEIVRLESGDEWISSQWRRAFREQTVMAEHAELYGNDKFYRCGAGQITFCITPSGRLKVCSTMQKHEIDLRRESFRDAWKDLRKPIDHLEVEEGSKCKNCTLRPWCSQCPAWAYLETGNEREIVPYLCELAHLRAEKFSDLLSQESG